MILVRFQSLLLLSNSFIIHVTDNFNHSKGNCVPFVRIAHIIFFKQIKYRWNGGNSSVWRYGWRLLWSAHEAPKSLVSG